MTILLAIALVSIALAIIWQDYASLNIDATLIYAFTALSLLGAVIAPLPDLGPAAHFAAGAIAAVTALATRVYFAKRRGIEALGEADVWLIAAAGLLLGPFLLGPWLFGAAAIAAILMSSGLAISGKRQDPEAADGVSVMPLTPVLLITMIILAGILHTEILPANQLPLL